jgi:hypothetical protein
MVYMMDKHTMFDETLTLLKNMIEDEAGVKMQQHGVDIEVVKHRAGRD